MTANISLLTLARAHHTELVQRQAYQLELLTSLSHSITTRMESEELYRTILCHVRRLIPCDLALLYLYHNDSQDLVPVAELACPANATPYEQEIVVKTDELKREKINLNEVVSIPALASIHGHLMLHGPAQSIPTSEGASATTEAEMAVPIISKGVLYGAVSLKRTTPFTREELRLVRNLSHLAAAALENTALLQEVRTDQEQLRAILASSSDSIALVGANARFVGANAAFERIFGSEPEQIVGMECMELFGCQQEGGPGYCSNLCMIHKVLQHKQPLPYIELDLPVQGTTRSVGLSITPVITTQQPFCLIVAHDVTAVREATQTKTSFISMITHELRSPLNAINGYLDFVLDGSTGELNEQMREFVRRARTASENLYALIENLLLISRADAGQWKLKRELIELQDIVAQALEEMELTATDNKIDITIEGVDTIPQLYADQARLQQVLRNLLSNALRFTPAGGQVTISASVEPNTFEGIDTEQEHVVLLRVSDTGYGIAPEFQKRIFERFYQVVHTAVGRKGQGLGLTTVQMIVELHGGKVLVESEPGKGSTFTCILPCLLS
jgi:PAS domain S-box-containing protein